MTDSPRKPAPGDPTTDVRERSADAIMRSRRTSMFVDEREVEPSVVEELCELAAWAPCHKRTWPWEFAAFGATARERFGNAVSEAMRAAGDDEQRVAKARTKYLRTPTILVVGSAPGDTPLRTLENRDATAAAIQNLLLAATARGLASFWSSCPRGCNDVVAEISGFSPGSAVVGIVYLGYSARTVDPPERPTPRLTFFTS